MRLSFFAVCPGIRVETVSQEEGHLVYIAARARHPEKIGQEEYEPATQKNNAS